MKFDDFDTQIQCEEWHYEDFEEEELAEYHRLYTAKVVDSDDFCDSRD